MLFFLKKNIGIIEWYCFFLSNLYDSPRNIMINTIRRGLYE